MATLELIPSGYTGSTGITTSSSYPISNGYTDTSSTTYARLSLSTSSTGYLYYTFDASSIPSNATIQSITGTVKARVSSTSRVTSTQCQLFTGTTAKGSNVTFASTSSSNIVTLSPGSSWARAELDDLRLKIGGTGSSSSQSKYIYFYGAELTITYVTTAYTVTTTLSGSGTISPSGATTKYDGDEYELTITPSNLSETVTVTNNGTDVTDQLVGHGAGDTISAVPESYTTTSISSGSSYAGYAVGHSAESPSSSGTSSNMYASSGSTGYATYSFDFSDIPNDAAIESVEVRCYGHRESSTVDSTHVSNVAVYVGSSNKVDEDFPSTSNSIVTLNPTLTRSELDSAVVRHTVGYYGGLVLGITFEVTYSTGSGITHYTYTYTVSGDATIAVTIGGGSGETSKLLVKLNGSWVEVTPYKKVNGSWVQQTDVTSVFNSQTNYVKGN